MTTRFLAYQQALAAQQAAAPRTLSPWAARALAASDGSRSHAFTDPGDYTLGDRVRADLRNEPSERELRDLAWDDLHSR